MSGTTPRPVECPVGVAALLAATGAATVVSTPPIVPAAGTGGESERQRPAETPRAAAA